MRIALLGPLRVESDQGPVQQPRGHLLRLLLALLATRNGEVVSVDEITEALWHGDVAIDRTNALHVQVSKVRRALSAGGDGAPLRTVERGYLLDVAADDVDVARFERLAGLGAEQLAGGRPDEASTTLDAALGLWRGPALAEFTADFAVIERHRLEELQALARERRVDALLACGRHEHVVAELEEAVSVDPLRERRWSQLMLALYRSGRQADALRAFARAREALIEEIGVEPGSALRELEQAILRQDPALEAAPAAALDARPSSPALTTVPARGYTTNVKRELSSFVGRAAELAQLSVLAGTRPLVSIIGPGGVGKTRLATEVASRPSTAWPQGTWMLELQGTSGHDGVARALLSSFGGHPGPANGSVDVASAVDVVAAAVGDAGVLLVLDNCEHVVADARAAAASLLARCANLHILVTSRVVLDVRGEIVRQLRPLTIDEAVDLFADRGIDALDGFAVDDANDGPVRSICEQVDRLPLGVELAAARLRAFTPAQLDAQLTDRLGALTASGDGRDPRHRTLPATVAWSYDLLFAPERALLRRLSVFRGSFALDAVEALLGGGGTDEGAGGDGASGEAGAEDAAGRASSADEELTVADAADALARLVDRSLVVAERGDREPRYRLLRTVADFAAAAASELGETAGLRRRHADWVAHLARGAGVELRGPRQGAWAARLADERPNIDAALAFAREGGDVATGLRTCVDLAWFALTTTALPSALDDLLALLADEGAAPPELRARGLAWTAVIGAGLPDAPAKGASSIALARSLGDEHLLAETLVVTAMPMSRHVRTADAAIAAAREGRALAGGVGDAWLAAAADAVEGGSRALTVAGLADAVSLLERAGRGYSALGDHRSAEINVWYLSQAHEDRGDSTQAEAVLVPFVGDARLVDTVPDTAGAILVTARSSWLAQRHGDTERAASYASRLTSIATLQQRRLFWGAAQFAIGHAAFAAGDLEGALTGLTAALDMHGQIGMERFVILEHALLGQVAQSHGRDAESVAHHDEALRRAEAYALPLPRILALELAAQSARRRQQPGDAVALQARATALRATEGLVPTPHEQALAEQILR